MASRISWTRATLTSLSLFCRFDKWRAAALKSTLPLLPAVVAEDTLAPAASFRPLAIGLAVGPFNEGEVILKKISGNWRLVSFVCCVLLRPIADRKNVV